MLTGGAHVECGRLPPLRKGSQVPGKGSLGDQPPGLARACSSDEPEPPRPASAKRKREPFDFAQDKQAPALHVAGLDCFPLLRTVRICAP
jgi:hypothetical protein